MAPKSHTEGVTPLQSNARGMSERFKEPALNTGGRKLRGFESHSLCQPRTSALWTQTQTEDEGGRASRD